MRFDLCRVLPFLDAGGVTREARVLAERDGRALVMVTMAVGMTHMVWRPSSRRSVRGDSPL